MQEFIDQVTNRLGIEQGLAKKATGTALGFLKNKMGDQFSTITEKLPGAGELVVEASAEPAESKASGMLGGIKSAASGMLGGGAGEGLELAGALQKTGLSAEQSGSFITMFVNFIKEKVGDGVVSQIADKIPMLKSFS